MTNETRASDEPNRASGTGDKDGEDLKQELLAAWKADHPEGTRQQFDDEWAAMTSATRPSDAPNRSPYRWDEGPEALKRKLFEEWKAARPDGTMEQFEGEWGAVTAISAG